MKKLVVLLMAWFGVVLVGNAGAEQASSQSSGSTTESTSSSSATPTSTETASDNMGNGSGDDIDTVDEGDPSHDKDPEADDTGPTAEKS